MDYRHLAHEVCQLALEAGAAILKIYEASEGIQIERKADDSPLTQADQESNRIICAGLEEMTPDIPIISEENKEIPYEIRKGFSFNWLVDPLDGTKEFIKRNGEFTVNIALIYEQEPVIGVVYIPVSNQLYWGAKGLGAYEVREGKEVPLHAATFHPVEKGLKLVCSRSHMSEATQAFVDQYSEPQLVSRGSSLKFLLLAEGQAHIYPRLAPTMEWDTAAAQIILEEAGGQVISEETKAPLRYNKENLLNPYFIAYGNQQ